MVSSFQLARSTTSLMHQNKANLHRFFTFRRRLAASRDKLGDWSAWILRVVSWLLGNLDEARAAAAVRPGTTRKVGVRNV